MTPDPTDNLPNHIAIIMDGNNRWARANGLSPRSGHRHGAEAAREIVHSCIRRGINYLTLFAFSSENWMRPAREVQGLMALFLSVLKHNEIKQLHENNVRLRFIGNRAEFSTKLQTAMAEVEEMTASNTGNTVIVAADYGGRWDGRLPANGTQEVAIGGNWLTARSGASGNKRPFVRKATNQENVPCENVAASHFANVARTTTASGSSIATRRASGSNETARDSMSSSSSLW